MSDDTIFWAVCRDSYSYAVYRVIKETPKQVRGYRMQYGFYSSYLSAISTADVMARLKTKEDAFRLYEEVNDISVALARAQGRLAEDAASKIYCLFEAAKSETREAR